MEQISRELRIKNLEKQEKHGRDAAGFEQLAREPSEHEHPHNGDGDVSEPYIIIVMGQL